MKAELENKMSYLEAMGAAAFDKLFYISILDNPYLIVDYGCADGTMLAVASAFFPKAKVIGFDTDEEMLAIAREKVPDGIFTSNWGEVIQWVIYDHGNTCIILSSIIHEIYSYMSATDVKEFWKRVFEFDTVIIRDMMPSQTIDRPSDMTDVINIRRKYANQARDFEMIWGSLDRNKNLVHFLLKYLWTDNWEREVRENYFPLSIEEFMTVIPEGYEAVYWEHFALHYLKNRILEDTGVVLKDNTHLKVVLRKTGRK